MSLLSNYLLPNELNVVITSSSENSSLDSYELEFENDVKWRLKKVEIKVNTKEIINIIEEFKVEEIVSKIKTLKKKIRNKIYNPILINYKEFIKVFIINARIAINRSYEI